jgi:hypothetical protein
VIASLALGLLRALSEAKSAPSLWAGAPGGCLFIGMRVPRSERRNSGGWTRARFPPLRID